MSQLARLIDILNGCIGRACSWLILFAVLVQFIVIMMRHAFGVGSIFLQESIIYMHAAMFMLAAGYTLLDDGHVRVDIFYRDASEKTRAWVNLSGALFFIFPLCTVIIVYAAPYVAQSWAVLEGSRETSGIQGVFILKSIIPAFAVLVALQGLAMCIRAVSTLRRTS